MRHDSMLHRLIIDFTFDNCLLEHDTFGMLASKIPGHILLLLSAVFLLSFIPGCSTQESYSSSMADEGDVAIESYISRYMYDGSGNQVQIDTYLPVNPELSEYVLSQSVHNYYDETDRLLGAISVDCFDSSDPNPATIGAGDLMAAENGFSLAPVDFDNYAETVMTLSNAGESVAAPLLRTTYRDIESNNVSLLQVEVDVPEINENAVSRFTFDETGNLMERTDETLDSNGQVTEAATFDDGNEQQGRLEYVRNAAGEPVSITTFDATNEVESHEEYRYNEAGLLASKTVFDGEGAQVSADIYSYDSKGQLLSDEYTRDFGASGTMVYEYDDSGNLISSGEYEGGAFSGYRYEYDAAGNKTREVHVNNNQERWFTSYSYDAEGRLVFLGVDIDVRDWA